MQAATLSSPSIVARVLADHPRTILIDEAEKSLHPKKEHVGDLLAVINAGYRKGATRPVNTPSPDGNWKVNEMSIFGPIALAGNAPNLPEDTKQRCIKVLLLPDNKGEIQDSDWQWIENEALALGGRLAEWADQVRKRVATDKFEYPAGLIGRSREVWAPLLKIARAATPQWNKHCLSLIDDFLQDQEEDRKAGLERRSAHVELLRDIRQAWPKEVEFWPTEQLITGIKQQSPHRWTKEHKYGELTVQALGRMLSQHYGIRSQRESTGHRRRGYFKQSFSTAWDVLGEPDELDELDKPDLSVA